MNEVSREFLAAQRWLIDLKEAREKGDMTAISNLILLEPIVNALRTLERFQFSKEEDGQEIEDLLAQIRHLEIRLKNALDVDY